MIPWSYWKCGCFCWCVVQSKDDHAVTICGQCMTEIPSVCTYIHTYMWVLSSSFRCNNAVLLKWMCSRSHICVTHIYILWLHISIPQLYMAESELCGRSLLITSCVCCHFLCEVCTCAYIPPTLYYLYGNTYVPYGILHHYLTYIDRSWWHCTKVAPKGHTSNGPKAKKVILIALGVYHTAW